MSWFFYSGGKLKGLPIYLEYPASYFGQNERLLPRLYPNLIYFGRIACIRVSFSLNGTLMWVGWLA